MADNMTTAQRSRTMSRIHSKNTQIELQLRKALFRHGYRYRVHVASLPGRPDIAFLKRRVAIFVDGDFWHGYDFEQWAHKLSPFWFDKIQRNRERDSKINALLIEQGWGVIRIWEHEIQTDITRCVDRVVQALG